ncbi:hypothetical protein [uncultured Desulfobacter sp.]|uniref:hypothetical protein n=1 Tax=uncultured Desulfobacter sp. TaxID=240139 RepID=UPI0029F4EA8C|nr:hypothetical protein [uncultured Desulfobacter sp.]
MIKSWLVKIKDTMVSAWKTADEVARYKAVDHLEDEVEEMEYIFAVLCQGAFIGMPAPPERISLDLLPEMEKDLILLMDRVETTNEPLSRLFSTFDI